MKGGVVQPGHSDAPVESFGPSEITHWTASAELRELGTYRQVFIATGESEPWTLRYEESIYVVAGEAWIIEVHPEGNCRFTAGVGSLTVIRTNTTVRYGGTAGTVLLLSISPID